MRFWRINRPAWLTGMPPEQTLVRLEALEWPLSQLWNISFDELIKLHDDANRTPDAAKTLADLLDQWNLARDNRPAFAAFLDEVEADTECADWPHALRDRLGLGHYEPEIGGKIPVALMRYSLQDVLAAQAVAKLATACALPTALDGGMHEFFFPVPREQPYGATLHLAPGKADLLTAEIIHCRINYDVKHIWKFGWIERTHALAPAGAAGIDDRLRQARDLHLLQLRIDSNRDAFAEEMVGR